MRPMRYLVGFFLVAAVGCSPVYGRETCTTTAQCSSGLVCANTCDIGDAGPGTTRSFLCQKVCATDAECAGLGLKKPVCGKNACASGSKTCVDNPF